MKAKLTRRQLAVSGLAFAPFASIGSSAAAPITGTIKLEAPDDVYVDKIVAPQGPAKKGQVLLVLKSYGLLQIQNHLNTVQQHLDIARRPFTDGRVQADIDFLKKKADNLSKISARLSAKAATIDLEQKQGLRPTVSDPPPFVPVQNSSSVTSKSHTDESSQATQSNPQTHAKTTDNTHSTSVQLRPDGAQTIHGQVDATPNSGSSTYTDPVTITTGTLGHSDTTGSEQTTEQIYANPDYLSEENVRDAAAKAENDYLEAALVAGQADLRAKEALERLQDVKSALTVQLQIVGDRIAALTISASVDGNFNCLVAGGLFVKKGHLLGTIG